LRDALATENKVNVLSSPSIITSENKKAVITQIGDQGTVSLDVKQKVNDVGENEPPPINSPRIKKCKAETSVVLLNNQTLILGGLIQNTRTKIRTGIPFSNRVPVLGYLFGSTEEKIEKTELRMFITPQVVGTAVDAARITEQIRRGPPEIEQSLPSSPSEALEHAPPGCSS
jgi:general secretion pathway protein D